MSAINEELENCNMQRWAYGLPPLSLKDFVERRRQTLMTQFFEKFKAVNGSTVILKHIELKATEVRDTSLEGLKLKELIKTTPDPHAEIAARLLEPCSRCVELTEQNQRESRCAKHMPVAPRSRFA